MPLKLTSSGGGSVTLDVPSTASDFTATMPANTGTVITTGSTASVTQGMLAAGVVGNGPAFFAYRTTNQTISNNTWTKVSLNAEDFDLNGNFDPATNYRFTPTVAGYYQFSGCVQLFASSCNALIGTIYKNGAEISRGADMRTTQGSAGCPVGALLYMNGTTDYVELYCYISAISGTPTIQGVDAGARLTYFTGFLARAA